MQKLKNISYNILLLLIILLLTCGTYKKIFSDMQPDLDYSWIYALHYIFLNGIEHGKDVIFPYGPLGFLFFGLPEATLPLVNCVHFILSFLFIAGIFLLCVKSKTNNKYRVAIGFIAAYILGTLTNVIDRVTLIPLVFLLLREETQQKRYFFSACIFSALAFLGKIGFGFLTALAIFSYSLYKLYTNIKPAEDKKLLITNDAKGVNIVTEVAIAAIIYFVTLCGMWFILYGNLTYLPDFIIWSKEVCLGYAQTMLFFFEKNYILFAIILITYLVMPFLIKNKELRLYHLITILMTLFYLKYAFIRHQNYIFTYFTSYIVLCLFYLKQHSKLSTAYLLTIFLAIAYFNGPVFILDNLKTVAKKLTTSYGIIVFQNELLDSKFHAKFIEDIRKSRHGLVKLQQKSRDIIGESTVDIFPYEQTFIYANSLNWKPRFMFQAYMENTENLDNKTSLLFQSPDAPEFILWHKKLYDFDEDYDKRGVISVDRRYLFNDDPQTLYQILNNYIPVDNNKISIILKKTNTPQIPIKKEYPADNIKINEWTDVKEIKDNIMLLKIYPQRTFLGKIMNFLDPDVFSYIDYKFYDGTIVRFKFPLASTVKHGIWITPFVEELDIPFTGKRVQQIRIAVDFPQTLEKTIPATWIAIPYKNSQLDFDFSKDNLLIDYSKRKDKLKQYDLKYTSTLETIKDTPKEINKTLKPTQPTKLKKDKNYVLSISLKSKTSHILYPKNRLCQFKISPSYAKYPKPYALMILNNGDVQESNILFQNKIETDLSEINIECNKNTTIFSDVKAKLYEL